VLKETTGAQELRQSRIQVAKHRYVCEPEYL
jgi:hypothetical protein